MRHMRHEAHEALVATQFFFSGAYKFLKMKTRHEAHEALRDRTETTGE